MALTPPAPRAEVHLRDLALRGYRRHDGLFDIEGRLLDRKNEPFQVTIGPLVPTGAPIHDMTVRLTIDDEFRIVAAEATSDTTPYALCLEVPAALGALVGCSIAVGWKRTVQDKLGGVAGCSHINEILFTLASVAFQTLIAYRRDRPEATNKRGEPILLDTCHAFDRRGVVAQVRWPDRYVPPGSELETPGD